MWMGEKREDKQQTERERERQMDKETEGREQKFSELKLEWKMALGEEEGGESSAVSWVHTGKNKQVLKIEFEGKPASLVNVFRYK